MRRVNLGAVGSTVSVAGLILCYLTVESEPSAGTDTLTWPVFGMVLFVVGLLVRSRHDADR